MRAGICAGTGYKHVSGPFCVGLYVGMRAGVCLDVVVRCVCARMGLGMRVDMRLDMCVDMCNAPLGRAVSSRRFARSWWPTAMAQPMWVEGPPGTVQCLDLWVAMCLDLCMDAYVGRGAARHGAVPVWAQVHACRVRFEATALCARTHAHTHTRTHAHTQCGSARLIQVRCAAR